MWKTKLHVAYRLLDTRRSFFAHCRPPPPNPIQIAKNVLAAAAARRRIKETAPLFLGDRVDAALLALASDIPGAVGAILRVIRLVVALRCLKWVKLTKLAFRAVAVLRNRRRGSRAARADAHVVAFEHDSIRHLFRRARRRFSVI